MKLLIFCVFTLVPTSLFSQKNNQNVTEEFGAYQNNYFGFTVDQTNHEEVGRAKLKLSKTHPLLFENTFYWGYIFKSWIDLKQLNVPTSEYNCSSDLIYKVNLSKLIGSDYFIIGLWKFEMAIDYGPESRKAHSSYLETRYIYKSFSFTPRISFPSIPFQKKITFPGNEDILEYKEFLELCIRYENGKRNIHQVWLNVGNTFRKGNFQYQWTIGISDILTTFGFKCIPELNTSLILQYWNGYGESLKNYKQYSQRVMIGISLTDLELIKE